VPDSLELVGIGEIAELTGVTKQAVANWRTRDADFPTPVADLRSGPVWNVRDVITWAEGRGLALNLEPPQEVQENGGKRMALTVAVVNMKGGVGKSTLTANLGWYCGFKKNRRVLLVDLDPQFNLSQYAIGSQRYEELFVDKNKPTVLDVFEQHTPTAVSGVQKKSVSPAEVILSVKEWRAGGKLDLVASRLELAWTLKNPHQKEHLLAGFLKKVSKDYDLILIDCAPTESMLTEAAYLASKKVLVPVKPEFLSTIGLPLLIRSIENFQDRYDDRTVDLAGILFNSSSNYKAEHERSKSFVSKIAKSRGWYVFSHEVSYSDSYPTGARMGKPIFLTDYARWWKVAEFDAVAEEFVGRLGL